MLEVRFLDRLSQFQYLQQWPVHPFQKKIVQQYPNKVALDKQILTIELNWALPPSIDKDKSILVSNILDNFTWKNCVGVLQDP